MQTRLVSVDDMLADKRNVKPEHFNRGCATNGIATVMRPKFLSRLPREIRDMIYGYIVDSGIGKKDDELRLPMSLTQVSKQVREESLPIIFQNVTLDSDLARAATRHFNGQPRQIYGNNTRHHSCYFMEKQRSLCEPE